MVPCVVDAAQKIPHRAADLDIHAGGRLVENQQARLVHQRAGDHQAALHAAGQRARNGRCAGPRAAAASGIFRRAAWRAARGMP